MQAFNDYVYNQGQSMVLNAYLLLSESDNNDPGLTVGLNILEGAFWAIGSEFGPVGNFAASFLSGMVSYWATSTPPSLNSSFASLLLRLQATSLETDQQLAGYYQNVAGNWNVSFTYNGKTCVLSDLATVQFPAETNQLFEQMAAASLFALDQSTWLYVLTQNFQITAWIPSTPDLEPGSQNSPPISSTQSFYAVHPAYYHTWVWQSGSGCGSQSGWLISEFSLGGSPGMFSDAAISNDAANYLFIDSTPGVVINANGLYNREQVFTNLGIAQHDYYVNTGGAGTSLSAGYLRAMKEKKTLTSLIESEGREKVQARVIEHAQANPAFAHELKMRPRQALEDFLGVKIAELISLSVIVENPRSFGVVIPYKP
jgi:hypothetical protein